MHGNARTRKVPDFYLRVIFSRTGCKPTDPGLLGSAPQNHRLSALTMEHRDALFSVLALGTASHQQIQPG